MPDKPSNKRPLPKDSHAALSPAGLRQQWGAEFCDAKQFCTWKRRPNDRDPRKFDKVPYYADGETKRYGVNGSPADRARLVTLFDAFAACARFGMDGVGLCLLDDADWSAVDLDNCLDANGKLTRSEFAPLLNKSYTEISPSGTGLRMLFAGKTALGNRKVGGCETFDNKFFVTLTGHVYGAPQELQRMDGATRAHLANLLGGKRQSAQGSGAIAAGDAWAFGMAGERVRELLFQITDSASVTERERWVPVGMAVHAATCGSWDVGFPLWDEWSRRAGDDYGGTEDRWRSFSVTGNDTGRIGVGSLVKWARAGKVLLDSDGDAAPENKEPIVLDDFIVDGNAFADAYVAPEYVIDGLILQGQVHTLTARPGSYKTSTAATISLHTTNSKAFCGRDIMRDGLVLYLCGENPTDLRARLVAGRDLLLFNVARMHVLPVAGPLDEILPKARAWLQRQARGIEYVMAIVDTIAAYNMADNENDNVQMHAFARCLRELTSFPGNPAVIALAHPRLHGNELIPRGGSALFGEIDTNLTLTKFDDLSAELHFY